MACSAESPHMSVAGFRLAQTDGRNADAKIRQRFSWSSCTQRTPAGLPSGIPGMEDEIEGATQHAPHPGRHAGTLRVDRLFIMTHAEL